MLDHFFSLTATFFTAFLYGTQMPVLLSKTGDGSNSDFEHSTRESFGYVEKF